MMISLSFKNSILQNSELPWLVFIFLPDRHEGYRNKKQKQISLGRPQFIGVIESLTIFSVFYTTVSILMTSWTTTQLLNTNITHSQWENLIVNSIIFFILKLSFFSLKSMYVVYCQRKLYRWLILWLDLEEAKMSKHLCFREQCCKMTILGPKLHMYLRSISFTDRMNCPDSIINALEIP